MKPHSHMTFLRSCRTPATDKDSGNCEVGLRGQYLNLYNIILAVAVDTV